MQIKELSEKTGASIRSIRHYEARGLIQSRRLANGYRTYENDAVFTVKTIHCPLAPQTNRPICKAAYKLYHEKLEQVTAQIHILQQVQSQLEEKIERSKEPPPKSKIRSLLQEHYLALMLPIHRHWSPSSCWND